MGKSPKNLTEAIRRLEKEAKPQFESKLESLKQLYEELKPYLDDVTEAVGEQFSAAAEAGSTRAKKTSGHVDQAVHKKPWLAIAVIGLVCFVAGIFLGHKRE